MINQEMGHNRGRNMKKISIVMLVLAFMLCSMPQSFAQLRKDMNVMKGSLTMVGSGKSKITVKDNSSGKEMTFVVKRGVDESLVVGKEVSVMYKAGTNVANSVKVVQPKTPAPAQPKSTSTKRY